MISISDDTRNVIGYGIFRLMVSVIENSTKQDRAPEGHMLADNEVFKQLFNVFESNGRLWRLIKNLVIAVVLIMLMIILLGYSEINNPWFPIIMILANGFAMAIALSMGWAGYKGAIEKALDGRDDIGYPTWKGFQMYDYWLEERSGAEFPDGFRNHRDIKFIKTPKSILNYLEGKVDRIIICCKYR